MITYQYTQKDWTTFKEGIKREWAVTNGIGGYAGSSMIGAHSRTHQGYLIASLHAPIERYLVFPRSTKRPLSEPERFPLRLPSTVLPEKRFTQRDRSFSLPLSMTEACTTPMRQTIFLLKSTSH